MAEKFTKESYMKFEKLWHKEALDFPYVGMPLGRATCEYFDVPSKLENEIIYERDTKKVQVIIWSSFNDTASDKELTLQELKRQDFVDGAIHEMICTVMEHVDPENLPEHNIEAISEIRDVIIKYYITGKYDEVDFYPYLEER